MIKKYLQGFFILALLTTSAFAQQTMTLQQCIDYALKNNLQIKQQEVNTKIAQASHLQSQAQLLPSINGSAGQNYNYGRNIDPVTNSFTTNRVVSQNFALSGNWNIFNGLQNLNSIKQTKFDLQASQYDLDDLKNDISLSVVNAYLQVLFGLELLDNSQNQYQLTEKQVLRLDKMLEVGAIAKSSLLDTKAQLANEELNVTTAKNNLDLAYLNLAQLMNFDSVAALKINKPTINDPNQAELFAKQELIYQTALASQPSIKSAQYRLKSSEKMVGIARGGLSPRLSLSASVSTIFSDATKLPTGNPEFLGYVPTGAVTGLGDVVYEPSYSFNFQEVPYNKQIKDNLNEAIGLRLTVPIFNNFQVKTSIDKAKLTNLNAKYSLELAENQLQKEIQQAYTNAAAALKKHDASKQAVQAFQESFGYAEQKFNLGSISSYDYNDAKTRLTKAQSDLLQAKYDYVLKLKVLDFYMGKPLVL
ncbi:MAG: TolC family protein [Bacteroidetes bacterium]|nr:TolC family protein [Bacteroidota bacterium]